MTCQPVEKMIPADKITAHETFRAGVGYLRVIRAKKMLNEKLHCR